MTAQERESLLTRIAAHAEDVPEIQTALTACRAVGPENGGHGEGAKAELIEKWLRDMGISGIEHVDAPDGRVPGGKRPNLIATIPGRSSRSLWLFAHMDVVPEGDPALWNTDPWKVTRKGDMLYGRGVEDNQQGLTSMLLLARALTEAGVTPELCPAVGAALEKAAQTDKPAGAMVLPDGRIITGKTSGTLGAAAALLLNALKALGNIDDQFELISKQVLEPVCHLKTTYLDHRNPRLHTDEVLLTLAISALTNPLADLAKRQLPGLRDSEAHFSVIISEEDLKIFKRLGVRVSCEPKYETKRLYHR